MPHKDPEAAKRYFAERYQQQRATLLEQQRARRRDDPMAARARDNARYERDREAIRARQKTYYEANREKVQKGIRAYACAHSEAIAAYSRRYYAAHKEQWLARREESRRWWRENRDKARVYKLRRRALKSNAAGTCTAEQLQARIAFYGGLCWVPGCRKPYEAVDHVIALSKGGSNWAANLRPICKHHNSQKGARDWRPFAKAA